MSNDDFQESIARRTFLRGLAQRWRCRSGCDGARICRSRGHGRQARRCASVDRYLPNGLIHEDLDAHDDGGTSS